MVSHGHPARLRPPVAHNCFQSRIRLAHARRDARSRTFATRTREDIYPPPPPARARARSPTARDARRAHATREISRRVGIIREGTERPRCARTMRARDRAPTPVRARSRTTTPHTITRAHARAHPALARAADASFRMTFARRVTRANGLRAHANECARRHPRRATRTPCTKDVRTYITR